MRELDWSEATGLCDLFRIAFSKCWEKVAFTDSTGNDIYYKDLAYTVDLLHQLFRCAKLQPGDRVALLGYNSVHWATVYIAAITYGAIIVPIPEATKSNSLYLILEHAQAKLLFVSEELWENLSEFHLSAFYAIISLQNWTILNTVEHSLRAWEYIQLSLPRPEKSWLHARMSQYYPHSPETPVLLVYTSGSADRPKGVLLAMRSLWHNVRYARKVVLLAEGDSLVALLPYSHIYGQIFDLLYGIVSGAHIYMLPTSPSLPLIREAFMRYRPRLIQIVSSSFERIFKSLVPVWWQRPLPHLLLTAPGIGKVLRNRIRKRIDNWFGGQFMTVVLGGTLLNPVIEKFLYLVGFRYSLGYGLTESAALVTYRTVDSEMTGTVGRPIDGTEVTIRNADRSGVGSIFIRGENLMLGYFKDPVESKASFDDLGWFDTGDLGYLDKNNYLYIKGRRCNAFRLENGALVSPEEIESLMNTMPCVQDSLVVEREGEIVALVQPVSNLSVKRRLKEADLFFLMERNRERVNARLKSPAHVDRVQIQYLPFELTAKRSIHRQAYLKMDTKNALN